MKNVVTIGDVHGRDFWKKVVQDNNADKYVFLGDYVDGYRISDFDVQNNLVDIIEFKQSNPDKVELLLGNHDIQYMFSYSEYGCSGFRESMYESLHDLFNHYKDLFKPCYQTDNYIWSHAGISKGWFVYRFCKSFDYDKFVNDGFTLSEMIEIQFNRKNPVLFDIGYIRGGSNKHGGGIFWADKSETFKKPIIGFHQMVGHTPVREVITNKINENTSITYCDTQSYNGEGVFNIWCMMK